MSDELGNSTDKTDKEMFPKGVYPNGAAFTDNPLAERGNPFNYRIALGAEWWGFLSPREEFEKGLDLQMEYLVEESKKEIMAEYDRRMVKRNSYVPEKENSDVP